ncbi:LINE-1 retrotransposable element ORF2 protein [Vitis vinifera]|uniref:LINE-1 retrotransposable element ORF2 protein n=1 Tax=Vitis vinifera TaxID=29760 RepID=A0A438E9R1_VITVI|nr:LINE-1 retrotransposable element ORF2 protein [Vitis vinifera]
MPIEQEGALSSDLAAQRAIRKGELEELILREEIHWKQKAKIKWVKEGDCNSKLFHKVANGRRNKNFIKILENERVFQDCWDVIKEDLVRVFAEFHNSGIINQNTNASFIVLLPKKRRLRGVLQETIHSTQGAFVQGRQILDAVLIANEIVDEKKRSGEEGVVFKIDFEKAYDHVNWDFLDHVLEKKGFSPRWRSWMRGCLSSVSYAILVNGNAKGWVKAARGLRQGDPLSPFLFTIVADVLSRMLLKAEERNLLEGFRVGRNRCRVSHLQFADDTILFASPREEEVQTLKSLLLVFGQISGLKVNLDKMIERISRRLDGWQKAYLAFGGVGEGKRDHLVRWEAVCKPRSIGGLGIGKILLRNRALLGKWLWRFPRESTSLWHQVILSIYGTHSNGWDANTIVRWSHRCPWKAIAQGFQDFSKYTRFIVGDGERIRFWEDLWWEDQILKDQYPRLFRVVMDKNIPISSILGSSRPFSWNFNFRRNLTDSEIEDLDRLMHSLDSLSQMPVSSPSFPTKRISRSSLPSLLSYVGLWHRLFQLAKMDWVPPKSISDMMFINYKGFGKSKRGVILWQNASIALIWVVWRERNARIFEDKARNAGNLWDSIHFLASLWAFCSVGFKGTPLNVLQLDWLSSRVGGSHDNEATIIEVIEGMMKLGEANARLKQMEVSLDAAEHAKQNAETEAASAKESSEVSKSEVKRIELMARSASVGIFLEGLDQCVKDGKDDKWEKGWKEKGRRYSIVREVNKAGSFIRLGVVDAEEKRYSICILRGRGGREGWSVMAEVVRNLYTMIDRREKNKDEPTPERVKAEMGKRWGNRNSILP